MTFDCVTVTNVQYAIPNLSWLNVMSQFKRQTNNSDNQVYSLTVIALGTTDSMN